MRKENAGLTKSFFARSAEEVAPELIGCDFFVDGVGGKIVETEAYTRLDPASHSFRGPTRRNQSMFGEPGTAYVYRIYGLHWCMNFVCAEASAVLLRALLPLNGLEIMKARRGGVSDIQLCSGPAKLSKALNITGNLDGASLFAPPFTLRARSEQPVEILEGERIGISRATELPWRFWLAGCAYVSRPKLRSKPRT